MIIEDMVAVSRLSRAEMPKLGLADLIRAVLGLKAIAPTIRPNVEVPPTLVAARDALGFPGLFLQVNDILSWLKSMHAATSGGSPIGSPVAPEGDQGRLELLSPDDTQLLLALAPALGCLFEVNGGYLQFRREVPAKEQLGVAAYVDRHFELRIRR